MRIPRATTGATPVDLHARGTEMSREPNHEFRLSEPARAEALREAHRARMEARRAVREAIRDALRSYRSERYWRM